jgi:hypothetical protein
LNLVDDLSLELGRELAGDGGTGDGYADRDQPRDARIRPPPRHAPSLSGNQADDSTQRKLSAGT